MPEPIRTLVEPTFVGAVRRAAADGGPPRATFTSNARNDSFGLVVGDTDELAAGDLRGFRWVTGAGDRHLAAAFGYDGASADLYLYSGPNTQDPNVRVRGYRTGGTTPVLEFAVYGPGGAQTAITVTGGSGGPKVRINGAQQTDVASVVLTEDQPALVLPNAGLVRLSTAGGPKLIQGLVQADPPAGAGFVRPVVNDGPDAVTVVMDYTDAKAANKFAGPADVVIPPGTGATFARFSDASRNRVY